MDAADLVREFDKAAERVFGFTRAEGAGNELAELIIPPALRKKTSARTRALLGGTIRAQSEGLGKGASFVIDLPLNRAD